jgi:hypothetical protein
MTSQLEGFRALVGEWTTEAIHPLLPDTVVPGRTRVEWLEGERFLILRGRNEHPDFPDSVCVIGATDEEEGLTMHYFDSRGVFRVYRVSLEDGVWRIWGDGPSGFSGRFSGSFSDDGDTLSGVHQLSRDGSTWDDDLAITYRRAS